MRALLICPNADLRSDFEKLAARHSPLRVKKSLDRYPDAETFRHLVKVWAPDAIFLSLEDGDAAAHIARQIDAEFDSLQRIGLCREEGRETFRLALQLRVTELLVPPFDETVFLDTLRRVEEHLAIHPPALGPLGQVYAFMPAKGGVGASTIAANSARAFANAPGTHVLLADFDVSSGTAGFVFNAEHDYSVNDAGDRTRELDDETWQRLVKKVGNVDLMLSGAPMVGDGIGASQIVSVLDYARRVYTAVGADVPDTLDERTLAVLREANRIFLVTTPDLGALRLAKLKIMALRRLDWEDKTKLLLNRVSKKMELSVEEIENTVGLPVYATFPCEYGDVTKATRRAEAPPKLVPAIRQFIEKLGAPKAEEKRTRFIERFALVPARYGYR
jgi:Flp pilus assembly CpaE family ATPase